MKKDKNSKRRKNEGVPYSITEKIDRRKFLKRMGLAAGTALFPSFHSPLTRAAEGKKFGERVPELVATFSSEEQIYGPDMWRKVSEDLAKIGLKVRLRPSSFSSLLDVVGTRTYGDLFSMEQPIRPERVDPSEFLFSRAHSKQAVVGKQNFGNYINPEYDRLVDAQNMEPDLEKRRALVLKAQEELAKDYYMCVIGYPKIIHAYNSEDWEGVVPMVGNGIADTMFPWTYLNLKSKNGKKKVIIGAHRSILRSINILADTGLFRNHGRFIYDTFVKLDKDLNVIPWAAESWKKIDNKTWDIKLRPGMKWHDDKPVTTEDVVFTFDYLLKWKPPIFSLIYEPVEKVEVLDSSKGLVRFNLKRAYGSFLTIVMMIGFPLPKHIWENIMEKQGVSDPTKVLVDKPIGSGFFKFGHYKRDQELLMVANKEHFYPPKIDELLITMIPSVDGLMGRLETKEIDFMIIKLTPSQANRLKKFKHISVVATDDLGFLHITPLLTKGSWKDVELRRALHHAIDKEFVVNTLWEGAGIVGRNTFIAPANKFWHNPNLPEVKFDLNKARRILEEAGYGWDKDGYLLYPDPNDPEYKKRIERVLAPR